MLRVVVFGATGLVGRVLVERLSRNPSYAVRAAIRGSGNAWGLARSGTDLMLVDLASKAQIARAVEGATHVVNCTRLGYGKASLLRNLLKVCAACKIQRFVHLSSIAVYGDPPASDSIHEKAPPNVRKGTYGWVKLQQDRLVARAHRQGLSCAVLCPANITGMRSKYLLELLAALREGRLALVDEGRRPYCATDVVNLCAAIEAALTAAEVDGRRIYIHDGPGQTWSDVIEALLPLADGQPAPPSIDAERARAILAGRPSETVSLRRLFRTIAGNGAIQDQLRKNPTFGRVLRTVKGASAWLPSGPRARLANLLEGRSAGGPALPTVSFDAKWCQHQLRDLVPSLARAQSCLGYAPPLSFARSMAMFDAWYRQTHGYDDPSWELLRLLYPHA